MFSNNGTLRSRFIRSAIWSTLGTFIFNGLQLLTFAYAARIMGKAGFGQLSLVLSTIGVLTGVTSVSTELGATRYVAAWRNSDKKRTGQFIGAMFFFTFTISLVLSVAYLYVVKSIALNYLHASELLFEFQVAIIIYFFESLNNTQRGILVGFEAFRAISVINSFRGVVTILFTIGGLINFGLTGAITGLAAASIAASFVSGWIIYKECFYRDIKIIFHLPQNEDYRIFINFTVPIFLSSIMVGPVAWWVNALLVKQPNGYEQLGIFNAATRVQSMVALFGSTIGTVVLPMLLAEDGKNSDFLKRFNMLLSWFLGLIPAVFFMLFPEIFGIIFGSDFMGRNSNSIFVIVMFYGCVIIYKQGLSRAFAVKELMWWSLLSNLVWALSLVVSVHLFIQFQAIGIALAYNVAYLLNVLIFIPLYNKKNLIPMNSIYSKEAIIIWGSLIAAAFIGSTMTLITARIIILLFIVLFNILLFKRLLIARTSAIS